MQTTPTSLQALKARLKNLPPAVAKNIISRVKDQQTSQGCFDWKCSGGKYHGHGVS